MIALERKIFEQASAIPGIKSLSVATKSPVSYQGNTTWFKIAGRPWHGEHNDTPYVSVTPNYFITIGAALLEGRYFKESEHASKPLVAMVNHKFARQFFPNGDALGQRLLPLRDPAVPTEIIGVVEDIKEGSLDSETRPTLYYPFAQNADNYFFVFARTSGDSSVLPSIASAIRKIDPEIVTLKGQSMDEQISQSAYIHRSLALLVGGFAGLALLLGVVGLYGVIAYSVSQRTREIGVRIALGAESIGVCRLILKDAGGLITWGLLLGIACSIGAARLMTSLLFEVTSWDIPTLAAVALVLSCSALLASFIPARRASLLNPVEALRAE